MITRTGRSRTNRPAPMRRPQALLASLLLATALLATVLAGASSARAATTTVPISQRASLTQIYNDVMCVVCHEPLAVANAPEAISERQYIRTLVNEGETVKQVEANLVIQYGPAVLALPPAHGFNLLVYIVPPLVILIGIATLALTLPRWRARTRLRAAQPIPAGPTIDPADAQRLEEELARD